MSSSSSDEPRDSPPAEPQAPKPFVERRWSRFLFKLWTKRAGGPDPMPFGIHFPLTLHPRLCHKCAETFRGLLRAPPALPVVTPD